MYTNLEEVLCNACCDYFGSDVIIDTPFSSCQVPQVYFSLKFNESIPIFDALGGVLLDAQEFHQNLKSFPLAKAIQRFVQ